MSHENGNHTGESLAALHQELAWNGAPLVAELDVAEGDDAYRVLVDLPGVAEKDIEVQCDGITLTIAGERKPPERGHLYHRERRFGPFSRTIALKSAVDETAMQASYRDGVLEVRLPRAKVQTAPVKRGT